MGRLSTLPAWHLADPVDSRERLRNDLVFERYQLNRVPPTAQMTMQNKIWTRPAVVPEH